MDFNLVITAIGSLGFPIVACVAMAIFFREVNNNYRNDLKEANNNHKNEIDKLTEAINNNTLVITKLIDRMDKQNDND